MLATNRGKKVNACLIYTLLWCLYYLQGTLYPKGVLAQAILLLILMWSLYYATKVVIQNNSPNFIKALSVFIGVYLVYFLLSYLDSTPIYVNFVMEQRVTAFGSFKTTLMSLLPIYAYYYFAKKGQLQNVGFYIVILLILTTFQFIRNQSNAIIEAATMGLDQDEFTNNIAYNFVHLTPLLFLFNKKPFWQYAALLYALVFILMGMKRGAILIGALCFVYFLYNSYKTSSPKGRKYIVLLSICVLIGFGVYATNFIAGSDYFAARVEDTLEGNSSGRDAIYSSLIDHMLSRNNIGEIIFGEGLNKTVAISGLFAHNDWLELGINQGLIGIVVYILFFTGLWADVRRLKRQNKLLYGVLSMAFFIMFASTLFSMSYNNLTIGIQLSLGIALAQIKCKKDCVDFTQIENFDN